MNKQKNNKKEIKAIVFDVGGVLYKEPGKIIHKLIEEKFQIKSEQFEKARLKYIGRAIKGQINGSKYESLVAKSLGIKNRREFIDFWYKKRVEKIKPIKEVLSTLYKLRKNYLLACLTNVTPTTHKIRLKKGLYKPFKVKIFSMKVHLSKIKKKIFVLLLKRLKIKSSSIIFVDDNINRITYPKQLGMKTIIFRNNEQLVKDLKSLGVKI
jgi:epoxide hydrolase-like predicted phosphatase